MNKINVSALSETDLKNLVTNAKNVFNGELNAGLGLNQVRTHVAHLFGAKSWQSLQAAASKTKAGVQSNSVTTTHVGVREVFGNGWDPETTFTETFAGLSEDSVYSDMVYSFCIDAFSEQLGDCGFEVDDRIQSELKEIGIEGVRLKDLEIQIRAINPAERYDVIHLFTHKEVVKGYAAFWSDEERVYVREQEGAPAQATVAKKPADVQVIHYDTKRGMAIAVQEDSLVGFYKLDTPIAPTPDEYEWDNGFDFEFISPDQASALRRAGFNTIVNRFEAQGAISKG